MAISAEEIRAVQQKRADALTPSANEPPVESGAAWFSYILRWALVGSIVIVTCSISYYYVIFLPKQEQARTTLKALELSMMEQRMEAARQRTEEAENQKETEALVTAVMQETCLDDARKIYEEAWAEKCKVAAALYAKGLQDCLSRYRSFPGREESCKTTWGEIDPGENCSLSREAAQLIDDRYEKAKDECFKRYPS